MFRRRPRRGAVAGETIAQSRHECLAHAHQRLRVRSRQAWQLLAFLRRRCIMHQHSEFLKRICLGAAGGLAGTLAIQGLLAASKRWLPEALPPMSGEPGGFMVEQAEKVLPQAVRDSIPD